MSRSKKRNHPNDSRAMAHAALAVRARSASLPGTVFRDRWITTAVCILLALSVWAVFGQTLGFGFVNADDDVYVYENPAILRGLSWDGVVWAFTHAHGANWHPLTTLSHMLDCQLYGLNAWGHHLGNVLLHGATAILLFLVLRQMTGAKWRSGFVAAVFAIHPLRVESVAWVAERKDVLSGLFFMLSLWAYAWYVRHPRSLPRYAALMSLFAFGLMSKPMLVTLPFLLLLLDYWPLQRFTARHSRSTIARLVLEKIPLLLLSLASCIATIWAQKDATMSIQNLWFTQRLANALVAYVFYLWQMVYPVGLAVFYPHPGIQLPVWRVGASVVVLLGISIGVVSGRQKQPWLLVGWLWYLGMLVPVIGLMQVGEQAHADRYTYLPQIGLYILAAWGAVDLIGSWRHGRVVLAAGGAVILAVLLAGSYVQTAYWKDSVSLWSHALACTSGSLRAHYNLGLAFASQGKLDESVGQYEKALELSPDYAGAHNNLGIALARQGRLDKAVEHFRQATRLNPNDAQALGNLGKALSDQGKWDEGVQCYKQAIWLDPANAIVHFNWGQALAARGKLDEAIEHHEQALKSKPDQAAAHYNLGLALSLQGRLDQAIQHCEAAVRLEPGDATAHYYLGLVLAARDKLDEALPQLQQAFELATAQNDTALASAIREQITSYQQALPRTPAGAFPGR